MGLWDKVAVAANPIAFLTTQLGKESYGMYDDPRRMKAAQKSAENQRKAELEAERTARATAAQRAATRGQTAGYGLNTMPRSFISALGFRSGDTQRGLGAGNLFGN